MLREQAEPLERSTKTAIASVLLGVVVLLAGTIPRNLLFAANLRYYPSFPWAVPIIAAYLWLFWVYAGGTGPPKATARARRLCLRANKLSLQVWGWSLLAGALGIICLVLTLQLTNRIVVLPTQQIVELNTIPWLTSIGLLLVAAPVAGVVEEAAFRGYMQSSLEKQFRLPVVILITGTMFAIVHLDFKLILWPYYLAVAALYGTITYTTNSILPAVVLHTAGNLYSNFDLWANGQSEWQTTQRASTLLWRSVIDKSVITGSAILIILVIATALAYVQLSRSVRDKSA